MFDDHRRNKHKFDEKFSFKTIIEIMFVFRWFRVYSAIGLGMLMGIVFPLLLYWTVSLTDYQLPSQFYQLLTVVAIPFCIWVLARKFKKLNQKWKR